MRNYSPERMNPESAGLVMSCGSACQQGGSLADFLEHFPRETCAGAAFSFELWEHGHDLAVDALSRFGFESVEIVGEPRDKFDGTTRMDDGPELAQITEIPFEGLQVAAQDDEIAFGLPRMVQAHPIPQLQGHVAARSAEVVEREMALLHYPDDAIELTLPAFGKFQGATRAETRCDDAGNECYKKFLVGIVERDIEEDRVFIGFLRRWRHASVRG